MKETTRIFILSEKMYSRLLSYARIRIRKSLSLAWVLLPYRGKHMAFVIVAFNPSDPKRLTSFLMRYIAILIFNMISIFPRMKCSRLTTSQIGADKGSYYLTGYLQSRKGKLVHTRTWVGKPYVNLPYELLTPNKYPLSFFYGEMKLNLSAV